MQRKIIVVKAPQEGDFLCEVLRALRFMQASSSRYVLSHQLLHCALGFLLIALYNKEWYNKLIIANHLTQVHAIDDDLGS